MLEQTTTNTNQWGIINYLCSYRFWVIFSFLCTIYNARIFISISISSILQEIGINYYLIATIFIFIFVGILFGIVVAWMVGRSKHIYSLFTLSIITIINFLLIITLKDVAVISFAGFMISISSSAAIILIGAYFAQTAKNTTTFIIMFGWIYASIQMYPTFARSSLKNLSDYFSFNGAATIIIFAIVIMTILLFFANKNIFNELPKKLIINPIQSSVPSNNVKWTWADLFSSYQFWGCAIFLMLSSMSIYFVQIYLPVYYEHSLGLDYQLIEIIHLVSAFGCILSILFAWLACRINGYFSLYFLAAINIICMIILKNSPNFTTLLITITLFTCISNTLLLIIVAMLAKASNQISTFVVAFGMILLMRNLVGFISPMFISYIINKSDSRNEWAIFNVLSPFEVVTLIMVTLIIIGCLFLSFVKPKLFNGLPKVRTCIVNPHEFVSAIGTFFLFFIPLYSLFWYARVYSEIRNYSQSPRLLTPTGAVLCLLFVPFASLFILSTLDDEIKQQSGLPVKSGWGLILLNVFITPLAAAIVQSRLNNLYQLKQQAA